MFSYFFVLCFVLPTHPPLPPEVLFLSSFFGACPLRPRTIFTLVMSCCENNVCLGIWRQQVKLDYRLMPKNMQKQTKVDLGAYVQYVPAHVPLRAQETAGLEVIRFVSGNDRLLQEVCTALTQHDKDVCARTADFYPSTPVNP